MSPGPDTVHIACIADAEYTPHCAAMLHSVLDANRGAGTVQIHFLQGPDFSAEAAKSLAAMVDQNGGAISFVQIHEEWAADLATSGHLASSTWYRIFLPELLPDLDRVLYLDVDTIVLDSLAPLWESDLDDHYVAAVTNVFQLDHLGRLPQLGLDDPRDYFNAGVLLMNLELMRRDDCSAAVRDYALSHGEHLIWADQDPLNVVLGARRRPLHPRWNCMNSVLQFPWSPYVFGLKAVEEARRNPAIRHFEGPPVNKPWHFMCQSEMKEVYFQHRRQTPWPRYRLDGITPGNVLRRVARAGRWRAGRTAVRARGVLSS